MNTLFYLMMGFTLFCGITAVTCAFLSQSAQGLSERVLAASKGQHLEEPDRHFSQRFQRHVFSSVRWLLECVGVSADPRLRARFARAGFNAASYRDVYTVLRMAGPLAGLIAGSFVSASRPFAMISLAGFAYLAPDILLQRAIKRRRERIRLGIPDAVDLLVICVDAGLGMDQAMLRVGEELGVSHPDIYQEFLQISREQRAGKLRLEAWEAVADRCKLPEMDAFVNMLAQTERFGTPIARALSNFGDGIRQKRRQKAEEMAAKTTVKIIFPLVLCIFPSLFIVLLGPACITISQGLSGMGQ